MRDEHLKATSTIRDVIRDKICHLKDQVANLKQCLETLAKIEDELIDEAELKTWNEDMSIECGDRAPNMILTTQDAAAVAADLEADKKVFEAAEKDLFVGSRLPQETPAVNGNGAASPAPKATKKKRKLSVTAALKDVFMESGGRDLRLDELAALVTQRGVTVRRPSLSALISNFVSGAKAFPAGSVVKVARGVYRWEAPAEKAEPLA